MEWYEIISKKYFSPYLQIVFFFGRRDDLGIIWNGVK